MRNEAVLRNSEYIVLAEENKVNLHAWIPTNETAAYNIGDYLSVVVVKYLCEQNGIDFDQKVDKTKHLFAIGSILLGYQNATVWGSGFGYDQSKKWYFKGDALLHKLLHKTDVRAVRGPETYRILTQMGIKCPKIYGDPAIIMPLIYQPNISESFDYIVSPHYSKLEKEEYKGKPNIFGTWRKDYRQYIDKICSAKLVISSSLHGIILAEAYGIPAIMFADTPCEDITKYKDWYYSTGRTTFPIATSIEESLEITPTIPAKGVIEKMREDIIKAFPVDLWKEN